MTVTTFPPEVQDHLKYYVYRLIDPRNGETFYVGKGKGDRVFNHIKGDMTETDELSDKLRRILDITLAGLHVGHVIHRHGIEDEKTAFEIEAALMDAYPATSNIAGGTYSNDFGVMHADEIVAKYAAVEAVFHHPVVAININLTSAGKQVYEAVRYAWRIDRKRAMKAEYVLAVTRGVIVGVFEVDTWLPATPQNFPGTDEAWPGRYGFAGREANPDAMDAYLRKRIPDKFRKQGAANPVRYYGFD